MKKISTALLQVLTVALAISALALMLWEPHLEGRNAHATVFAIYFKDPFLAYAYAASIPFFVALYQTFKVLGHVRNNKTFSQATVEASRNVKYCAVALAALAAAPLGYLLIARPGDDIAGGVAVCLSIVFVSAVIATAAAALERFLQNGVGVKSANTHS